MQSSSHSLDIAEKTKRRFTRRLTLKAIRKRGGRLGISRSEIEQCHNISDLQSLAREKYRTLSKKLHPDHQRQGYGGGLTKGYDFRLVTRTYRWFMALPGDLNLSVPLPNNTLPDLPLPWEFDPYRRMPYGWQEMKCP